MNSAETESRWRDLTCSLAMAMYIHTVLSGPHKCHGDMGFYASRGPGGRQLHGALMLCSLNRETGAGTPQTGSSVPLNTSVNSENYLGKQKKPQPYSQARICKRRKSSIPPAFLPNKVFHHLFQLVSVLFLKPHREAIIELYILSYIVFPEWERQGKIKGARERKESREGGEQDFKR